MKNRNSGQSLVEFALILPVLLVLLLGIVEFGLAFNIKVTMINAAREGARYGSVPSRTEMEIKDRVKSTAIGLNLEDGDITVIRDVPSNKITVSITYDFTVFDPIISAIVGNTVALDASAVMSLE